MSGESMRELVVKPIHDASDWSMLFMDRPFQTAEPVLLNPAVEPHEGPVETSADAKPEGIGLGLEFVLFHQLEFVLFRQS